MKEHVYLIGSGNGLYKIGRTNNLVTRLATLQTGNPERLMAWSVQTDYPKVMEAELHRLNAQHRIRGEWFKLNYDQRQEIVQFFRDHPRTYRPCVCIGCSGGLVKPRLINA